MISDRGNEEEENTPEVDWLTLHTLRTLGYSREEIAEEYECSIEDLPEPNIHELKSRVEDLNKGQNDLTKLKERVNHLDYQLKHQKRLLIRVVALLEEMNGNKPVIEKSLEEPDEEEDGEEEKGEYGALLGDL